MLLFFLKKKLTKKKKRDAMGLFFFNRYKNELSSFLDHLLKCISQVSFLQGLSSLQVDDARPPILKSLKTKERLFPCLTEKVKLEGER